MIDPKQIVGVRRKQIASVLRPWTYNGHAVKKQIREYSLGDIQGCAAYYRCPDSIQMGVTLTRTGTSPPNVTIASASSLIGRSEGVRIEIPTAGLPGTGEFDISIDNGTTFLATNVTIPVGPGTYNIPTTDLTLTFQQGVSYSTNNLYRSAAAGLLDKVSAFATNNFVNASGGIDRPFTRSAAVGALGSPCLLFDGVDDFLDCTAGSIISQLSGSYAVCMLVNILALPTVAGAVFYSATNTVDVDGPRTELVFRRAVDGQELRANRVTDTGVTTTPTSGAIYYLGPYYLWHSFDGSSYRVIAMTADFIGGASGIDGAATGPVTANRVSLGRRLLSSGGSAFANLELYEMAVFPSLPSAALRLGVDCYFER